jgi:hypothetical protein
MENMTMALFWRFWQFRSTRTTTWWAIWCRSLLRTSNRSGANYVYNWAMGNHQPPRILIYKSGPIHFNWFDDYVAQKTWPFPVPVHWTCPGIQWSCRSISAVWLLGMIYLHASFVAQVDITMFLPIKLNHEPSKLGCADSHCLSAQCGAHPLDMHHSP